MFEDFEITGISTEKIEDKDVCLYIERTLNFIEQRDFENAVFDCNKAIKYSENDNDKIYCLYIMAIVLYKFYRYDKCISFINENLEIFKKEFGYFSSELRTVYTMLWHCYYRKGNYIKSLINMCNLKYFASVISTICNIFIAVIVGGIFGQLINVIPDNSFAFIVMLLMYFVLVAFIAFRLHKAYKIPKEKYDKGMEYDNVEAEEVYEKANKLYEESKYEECINLIEDHINNLNQKVVLGVFKNVVHENWVIKLQRLLILSYFNRHQYINAFKNLFTIKYGEPSNLMGFILLSCMLLWHGVPFVVLIFALPFLMCYMYKINRSGFLNYIFWTISSVLLLLIKIM